MAEKDNAVEIVKAGVIVLGTGAVAYGIYKLFFEEVPPEKYDFDFAATQVWPGTSSPYAWTPEQTASDLYVAMMGVDSPSWGMTDRAWAWGNARELNGDQLIWLNNWWIDNIDPAVSVYGWINAEVTYPGTDEREMKESLLRKMINAGINPRAGDAWF